MRRDGNFRRRHEARAKRRAFRYLRMLDGMMNFPAFPPRANDQRQVGLLAHTRKLSCHCAGCRMTQVIERTENRVQRQKARLAIWEVEWPN